MTESTETEGPGSSDPAGHDIHRPWLTAYPPHIDWNGPTDTTPVTTRVLKSCDRHADAIALDFFGATTTYGALGARIRMLAAAFQSELGIEKGTRVAFLMPNTPDFVACYYAVLMCGGIVVNCNPLYSLPELEHIVSNSGADTVITVDLKVVYDKADALARKGQFSQLVVCPFARALPFPKNFLFGLVKRGDVAKVEEGSARLVRLDKLEKAGRDFRPVEIDAKADIAVQQYTGGTTGQPKGAMLSHANIAANVDQICKYWDQVFQPSSSLVAVLPFFHIFAMTVCMNAPLATGVRINMLPRYEEKDFFALVKRVKPDVLVAVPTLCLALAKSEHAAGGALASIKVTVSGGAALPEAVRKAYGKINSGALKEGYGLTEASPVAICTHIDKPDKQGSIGQPIPGTDIVLVDVDDPARKVGPGEKGEITIRGPQVMVGYYDNDEANRTAFTPEGYLRTGDVAQMDEEGYIFIVDRTKDLIICSGFNVYPRAIEDAIYNHEAVEETSVIGVTDEYRGEAPIAYVKLKSGTSLDEKTLLAFLKDRLSKLEMPREIIFRDELPKTMIGKLSKKDLREDYDQRSGSND
ncbi:AMP-binding protein [Pelagibacterium montanilacus]|uniref:AMP-binding protein n=1 Tax=Pelagibacterium montanilacus TaxID=2185280 RepID=UPI000F8F03B5|nr:AMP-binding protein [Pelagibacterium montanilacus]